VNKNIYFIDSIRRPFSGGSIIRSRQLCEIFNSFNTDSHTKSYLSVNKDFKNSILVFNKYAVEELTEEEFENLKREGNIMIADPLDGVIKDHILSKFDVIFASSILQKEDYEIRFDNKISYVGHHVDLRIEAIKPEINHFNIGYFGELTNARYKDELSDAINFVNVDTSNGQNIEWMSFLRIHTAHYAIRSEKLPNQFKPFTKGFIAAYLDCPVLLAADDLEARYFLDENYPYFVNSNSVTTVHDAIHSMRDDFGGIKWKKAIKAMQMVKELCSINAVASQLIQALNTESIN